MLYIYRRIDYPNCFFSLILVLDRSQKWLLFFFNIILTFDIVVELKYLCIFVS